MEQLCCAAEKATKLLAELDSVKGVGLIERVKQGQGRPAKICLKKFTSEAEKQDFRESKEQTFENRNPRISQIEKQDFRNPKSNNTEINKNKVNNNECSNINQSITVAVNPDERWIDGYNAATERIKTQIGYDSLRFTHGAELVDEIVNIMAEVMTVDVPFYRIEGHSYPAEMVRMMFKKITYGKLDAFLTEFGNLADKIRNPKVNEVLEKLDEYAGLVIGSPVYYAGPTGQQCAFLDRLFFCSESRMAGKLGAAVVSCRRGGASAAFDRLNKYFTISNMTVVGSQYWNQVHGFTPDDVRKDKEGLQTMRTLAQNMAWLVNIKPNSFCRWLGRSIFYQYVNSFLCEIQAVMD